ncbi:hypothetical protein [Actinoplanes solisilvae]|nr:hypothetical protein [Actinoplanes solisilvae]
MEIEPADLEPGETYRRHVRGTDDQTASWSGWCEFTVGTPE